MAGAYNTTILDGIAAKHSTFFEVTFVAEDALEAKTMAIALLNAIEENVTHILGRYAHEIEQEDAAIPAYTVNLGIQADVEIT